MTLEEFVKIVGDLKDVHLLVRDGGNAKPAKTVAVYCDDDGTKSIVLSASTLVNRKPQDKIVARAVREMADIETPDIETPDQFYDT